MPHKQKYEEKKSEGANTKRQWPRVVAKVLLVLAVLAGLAYAIVRSGVLSHINSPESLRDWISGFGAWAGVVFFTVQIIGVIFAPIPSNVTTLAGALALGFWPGFLLSVLAVFCGSVAVFLLARKLGGKFVERFVQKSVIAKYLPIIEQKQDVFLFMAMLLPFFPDDALCILAGLTTMPFGRFCVIILTARPWGLLFAALVGGGTIAMPWWGWCVIGAAGLALFVAAMKYGDKVEERLLSWIKGKGDRK